ncbi:B12-binding domain-containing radical SAM protein [Tenacibaculum finnmarkense]|uniref:B12-binding domain-containing radical SAM protein n=1 Tax=Tenacibaculum finnmarkense TaxID=2781243 RepID=UPI000C6011E0|nr:B12-binding domain-containing radical SAM protein [Tenacibaculum finnmarkense]MCD8439159.1 radical SAM protein [Tenacibaculum finnmarkense genomovar ulcerans]MCG8206069.1 radical SAM protein [Tenacibaculum finnmarkense genomovar finnmarkense]MCG8719691.1 radical SAM protein [Tenacibaculum finnmarkense]MCG8722162.1 radical SAM protein [Tenacibaculum finnmarkense]MCG8740486.1 radical SAM protein [Tenacibaculum finnmarkense]
MAINTLLITPPFTQLNTAYPATAYIKGFLNSKDVNATQMDLSIELFTAVFTKEFIDAIFKQAEMLGNNDFPLVGNQQEDYIDKVDSVMNYLRAQEVTAAYQIVHKDFLPHGHRRIKLAKDLTTEFGKLGILDKAKHIATLFIEELGDFINANVDEFFSFTRYAEQLGRSASSFDTIDEFLTYETTLVEDEMLYLLDEKIKEQITSEITEKPYDLICFTVPFPGNLFSALRCAQFIKQQYPKIKIAMGGGYCNTELRRLSDPRIFNFVDFISLDDGEAPLLRITEFLDGKINEDALERTFICRNNEVIYANKIPNTIFHHRNLPAPSYIGLPTNKYLSFLDVMNPMHRMWSDGKWNKLTISHGCYWKQCSFCDVTLDYIGNYENTTADDLVNKIEKIISETGVTGFHFVDEAAPPKMLKALANKLLERKIFITWWTNIRFEKTFTPELCSLLSKSGCIAVTGGLEVASDRLLARMKKGVDIGQVARVTKAFSDQNIMVHAYLMFGFPTETDQETIDSLEVVRQLFQHNCIQSAFWHQFACTSHSPVGKNPDAFEIKITGPEFKGFAENDLYHEDPTGAEHHLYSQGLNTALNNYLNYKGFEIPLYDYFDFKVPKTTQEPNLIEGFLSV